MSRPSSRQERGEDTQPRAPRDADTDPRAAQRAAVHDDTQPRVVLDEGFLRDAEGAAREQEEKSSPSRPRTGPRRVRQSSPGMAPVQQQGRRTGASAVIRPTAPARVEEEEEDADVRVSLPSHDETRRTTVPVRPSIQPSTRRPGEDTRRTTIPTRSRRKPVLKWVLLLGILGALLAGAAVVAQDPALRRTLAVHLGLAPISAGPPPARPIEVASKAPGKSAEGVVAKAEPPVDAPPPGVAAPPAPVVETPPSVEATPEGAPGAEPDDVEPLAPEAKSGPASPKVSPPKRATSSRSKAVSSSRKGESQLKKEWKDARQRFNALTEIRSCENMGILCARQEDLSRAVDEAEGDTDGELLIRVKNFKNAVQKQLDAAGS